MNNEHDKRPMASVMRADGLESAKDFGERFAYERDGGDWGIDDAIAARDAQIAAWCEEHAKAAEREVQMHVAAGEAGHARDRLRRCEGRTSAWRAVTAALRSGK